MFFAIYPSEPSSPFVSIFKTFFVVTLDKATQLTMTEHLLRQI
jgi:ATP-dependent Clp protease adapter protein ClpS